MCDKPTSRTHPKIGVFIVAYNASKTIQSVLSRIQPETWKRISEVFIFDDASADNTSTLAHGYAGAEAGKIKVFKNQVNLGYGGNQKRGYRYAIDNDFDVVVLLHGDGQYAPEALDLLIAPIVEDGADAVFGSRMLEPGGARKGGMPLYKYFGNRVLSAYQNFVLGKRLSEYHSGFRAYSVVALKKLPLLNNSNDFHFDTEIIIQLMAARKKIVEVPIPTYYGDEICHVNGIKYAWNVVRATTKYGLHKKGLAFDSRFDLEGGQRYNFKTNRFSSHKQILEMLANKGDLTDKLVLDVGCGSGELAARISQAGFNVIGMDVFENASAKRNCAEFLVADIEKGLATVGDRKFDHIVFADVLEHLRNPEEILLDAHSRLTDDGAVVASTGNVAHIFIRMMLLLGQFTYTERGILDRTHVRLFTKRTFRKLFDACSYEIKEFRYCPVPFENILPGWTRLTDSFSWIYMLFVRLVPSVFAYQVIIKAEPRHDRPSELLRELRIRGDFVSYKKASQAE